MTLIREMFALMRGVPGFLGADLIPPETAGGDYHVVVRFGPAVMTRAMPGRGGNPPVRPGT